MEHGPAASNIWNRRSVVGGLLGLGGALAILPSYAQIVPPRLKLRALSIGIDKYDNMKSLQRAVADATAVDARLRSIGYNSSVSANDGVGPLLDVFGSFQADLDPETAAFVFIAGHGIQVAGRNYILPADTPPLTGADALSGAMPLDQLLKDIAAMRPAQTIVVLDACRNVGLGAGIPGTSAGLSSTVAPGGFFVAYSASSGEFALDRLSDDDPSKLGLFTRYFVEELRSDALIYDAISNTRAKVVPEAGTIGHAQHPAIYDQTSHPYRLDGLRTSAGRKSAPSAGSLSGTAVLIVAVNGTGCKLSSLVTPQLDAARLERALTAMDAEVTVLLEAGREAILEASHNLGRRGHTRMAIFWTGMGGLVDRQACILLEKKDCTPQPMSRGVETPADDELSESFDVISQGDIIAAVRAGERAQKTATASTRGVLRKKAAGSLGGKPLYIFFDACLDDLGGQLGTLEFAREPSLSALQNDEDQFNVAFLAASSYFQNALDAADGTSSSPFTIGILNALAMPGLTMAQFSTRVRDEVEALTKRWQTPQLFASGTIENSVFVNAA